MRKNKMKSKITIYTYKNCGTCRKATKWLDANNIQYTEKPIRETPPSKPELEQMFEAYEGEIKKLFNTSGQDYRAQGIKDKLPNLTQKEVFDLLTQNGNLVKRPFLISKQASLIGFKEEEWKKALT